MISLCPNLRKRGAGGLPQNKQAFDMQSVIDAAFNVLHDYQAYEAAKREWIEANPAATADEYEAASACIAADLGI